MKNIIDRKVKCSTKIRRSKDRTRICVYKSNKYNYVAIINDLSHKTITSMNDKKLKEKIR